MCRNRGTVLFFASLCLVRRVIRAAHIRYDRQVVFGLPHHLRMRSSPKLHVLKPWLNSFIFCLLGACSGDSDVMWVTVRGARWSRCDPALVRAELSPLISIVAAASRHATPVPRSTGSSQGRTHSPTTLATFSARWRHPSRSRTGR